MTIVVDNRKKLIQQHQQIVSIVSRLLLVWIVWIVLSTSIGRRLLLISIASIVVWIVRHRDDSGITLS